MSHGLAEYALPRCRDTARGIPVVYAGKRTVISSSSSTATR
jgi:hypothetical protein